MNARSCCLVLLVVSATIVLWAQPAFAQGEQAQPAPQPGVLTAAPPPGMPAPGAPPAGGAVNPPNPAGPLGQAGRAGRRGDAPGMPPGAGMLTMMQPPAIAVSDGFVFVVYGGTLFQFTIDGLQPVNSVALVPKLPGLGRGRGDRALPAPGGPAQGQPQPAPGDPELPNP